MLKDSQSWCRTILFERWRQVLPTGFPDVPHVPGFLGYFGGSELVLSDIRKINLQGVEPFGASFLLN